MHLQIYADANTCFDNLKTKAWDMFSLPCRVIIHHWPTFSPSGNINRQRAHKQRGKQTTRPQAALLFPPLFFWRSNLKRSSSWMQPPGELKRANSGPYARRGHLNSAGLRSDYNKELSGPGFINQLPWHCCSENGAYTLLALSRGHVCKRTQLHCRSWCVQTLMGDTGHSGWHVFTGHT